MQQKDGLVWEQVALIGGWNARDPLPNMPSEDAIELTNMIPDTTSVKKREGYQRQCDITSVTDDVETLVSYNKTDGTKVLIAGTNDSFYNVSTSTSSDIKDAGLTITDNSWQSIQSGGRLHLVNGVDSIAYYPDGSNKVAAASWTGITTEKMVNVSLYNTRVYFVEKDSLSVWYGNTAAISGGLTEYPMSSLFDNGGYLVFCGSSTNNIGDTQADLFIAMSSEGELLAFSGSYPGDSAWQIIGHFQLPRPMGYRAAFKMGSDLQIITEEGVIALSQVLSNQQSAGKYNALTDKISKAFTTASLNYRSNSGWQGVYCPKKNLILINIPITSATEQYVMNTLSGGWCNFQNLEAKSLCISDGNLYFGDNNGTIWKYGDTSNDSVYSGEVGDSISISCRTAFTDCGNPTANKLFTAILPIIKTASSPPLSLGLNIDYREGGDTFPIGSSEDGALWDTATWETSTWSGESINVNWFSVDGIGYKMSIILKGEFSSMDLEMFSFYILYKKGGVL